MGVDIKDLEKGSEGCPAAKQVAETTASPGSDGGGSKDPQSLARSGWTRTMLRPSPGLVGEEWPAHVRTGKELHSLEGKDTCRCPGERLWITKGGGGGLPRLCRPPAPQQVPCSLP